MARPFMGPDRRRRSASQNGHGAVRAINLRHKRAVGMPVQDQARTGAGDHLAKRHPIAQGFARVFRAGLRRMMDQYDGKLPRLVFGLQ